MMANEMFLYNYRCNIVIYDTNFYSDDNTMKIIFLDIDEVLNSVSSTIYNKQRWVSSHDFEGFSPIAVALLKQLVIETDAKIVLSSTWRLHYDTPEDCINDFEAKMWKYYKWKEFPIIGMTPKEVSKPKSCRGDEIKEWMDLHYVENYVIIDDSTDMLDSQQYHFVRVDYRTGFDFINFQSCLRIIGEPNNNFLTM
jgi:hypothetical protein